MKRQYAFQVAITVLIAFTLALSPAFVPVQASVQTQGKYFDGKVDQTEAGFLDTCYTPNCNDPYGVYSGSSWYCVDRYVEPPFTTVVYVLAGPFQTQPSQQFCAQF